MERHSNMDLSCGIRIPGVGGGGSHVRGWWDSKTPFGVLWNDFSRASSRVSCSKLSHGFSQSSGKMLLCLMILVLHVPGLVNCDTCRFPNRWSGSWFQKGSPDPIRIYEGTLSSKGTCRGNDGDKFLIENTLDKCYRCVVLHEKHPNVLQYKETYCSHNPSHKVLESLCSEINGDALLFSMFRLNTAAVECPFRGSYSFSYSRGHGECAYPPSSVESCTDSSRLLLRFQACADVQGSESRVEELVCLATWKEGSTRYLVGKLEHRVAKADEDKFRCFVYEKIDDDENVEYQVAQSGDATCDGLFTAYEGSRTMRFTKTKHPVSSCSYPPWFTHVHHWRGLDGRLSYAVDKWNSTFRVSNATLGDLVKRVLCVQNSRVSTSLAQFVVHVISGCNSGYTCLRMFKRAPHVVELRISNRLSQMSSEVCQGVTFDPNSSEIATLTTQSYGSVECPLTGIYWLEGNSRHLSRMISLDAEEHVPCSGTTTLTSGCSAEDKMELLHECSTERRTKSFQCRGSWEENGTNYVIATAVGSRKHLCLAYSESDRVIHFSGSTEACLRNVVVGKEGALVFNGTSAGYCPTTDSAPLTIHFSIINWAEIGLLALTTLFLNFR